MKMNKATGLAGTDGKTTSFRTVRIRGRVSPAWLDRRARSRRGSEGVLRRWWFRVARIAHAREADVLSFFDLHRLCHCAVGGQGRRCRHARPLGSRRISCIFGRPALPPRSRDTSRNAGSRCPGRRVGDGARIPRMRAPADEQRSRWPVVEKPTRRRPRSRPSRGGAPGRRRANSRWAENPSHGCSTTSAPKERAIGTVSSAEPESTTTVWFAHATESRHRRMFGSSSRVSTTTLTGTFPRPGSSPARYGRSPSLVTAPVPAAS